MKLKGISKLILAGTALAATAATLTTSTYAWYVTNNKVEATGVSGATAGENVAGSLLISHDTANTTPENYTTKITFGSSQYTHVALDPQTKALSDNTNYYYVTNDTAYNSEHTYYTKGTSAFNVAEFGENPAFNANTVYYEAAPKTGDQIWVDKEGKKIDSPKFVTFKFWLKSSTDMSGISVYTKFANSASGAVAAEKRQTFYAGAGLPTGKVKGDTFVVDAVYALRMEVKQEAYTISGAEAEHYDLTADIKAVEGKDYYTRTGSAEPYSYVKMNEVQVGETDVTGKYEYTAATSGNSTLITGDENNPIVVKEQGCVENHNACYPADDDLYKSPTYTENNAEKNVFDSHTGGDANTYYRSVMQKSGFGTDATNGTSPTFNGTSWTSLSLKKNVDNLITIKIWLEGTDSECWDSCIGQNFTLNLLFEKSGL